MPLHFLFTTQRKEDIIAGIQPLGKRQAVTELPGRLVDFTNFACCAAGRGQRADVPPRGGRRPLGQRQALRHERGVCNGGHRAQPGLHRRGPAEVSRKPRYFQYFRCCCYHNARFLAPDANMVRQSSCRSDCNRRRHSALRWLFSYRVGSIQ